jgi:hypothetical protein
MKVSDKPTITLSLLAINTFVFILELIYPIENYFSFVPAHALAEPWTFVTAMFLHADFTHLFFNMFALFMFGIYLENKIDKKTYLIIYFVSGIFGNIGYMLTAPDATIPGLGASGAIFGIMGTLAVLAPTAIIYLYGVPMPMLIAAFFWALTEFLGVFVPSGIAHGAHLGGLFFGIFCGMYLRSRVKN